MKRFERKQVMKKILLAMIATTAAISASAATVKDLSDKEVLTIDANTTWYGTTGQSPINVPGNTRAVINIKKGVTLTVYGADASGQTFGVPAIYVPPTATLYITGEGKLVAVGGNGDNGEGHGWSYVTINGKNYHIDPTFVMGKENCLSYFMMTDEQRGNDGYKKDKNTIACHYKGDHNGSKYDASDDFFAPLWGGTLTSWDHKKKIIYYDDINGNPATFDYSSVG